MKVSVNLPEEDVAFLEDYAHTRGYSSRSAALHQAVLVLRAGELVDAYEQAWRSWEDSGDAEVWETTTADGRES